MTSHQTDAPGLNVLLAEAQWVRSLARVLVEEAGLAEDAAQEVWVAALRSRPAHSGNLRGWLAQVTRNAVRRARRTERRRSDREERVARSEELPSTLSVVEHFSTQQAVASAVLALDEPYRETVLMRYYQDLSLREIGLRMGGGDDDGGRPRAAR